VQRESVDVDWVLMELLAGCAVVLASCWILSVAG
jgi:hypothetical protein